MRKFWLQATHKDVLAVIVFSSVWHGPKFHPRDLIFFEKKAGPTSMVFPGSILNVGGGPLVLSLIRWQEAQPMPSICGLPATTCAAIFSAYCGNTVVDGTCKLHVGRYG